MQLCPINLANKAIVEESEKNSEELPSTENEKDAN